MQGFGEEAEWLSLNIYMEVIHAKMFCILGF